MASSNYREHLKTDMVKTKSYFYVLRPLLACRWILERGTPPPVPFSILAEHELEPEMKPVVAYLLKVKVDTPEIKTIPRVDVFSEYLKKGIKQIEYAASGFLDQPENSWEELNELFLSQLI